MIIHIHEVWRREGVAERRRILDTEGRERERGGVGGWEYDIRDSAISCVL